MLVVISESSDNKKEMLGGWDVGGMTGTVAALNGGRVTLPSWQVARPLVDETWLVCMHDTKFFLFSYGVQVPCGLGGGGTFTLGLSSLVL